MEGKPEKYECGICGWNIWVRAEQIWVCSKVFECVVYECECVSMSVHYWVWQCRIWGMPDLFLKQRHHHMTKRQLHIKNILKFCLDALLTTPAVIWSYKITDFAQYLPAFRKFTRLMYFIRCGGLCEILTGLVRFTRHGVFIWSSGLCIISTGLANQATICELNTIDV